MNLEKGLKFLRLLHTILDIRLHNYELKIIKVLSIGVAKGGPGPPPPIKIPPMIKITTTFGLALFSCSFFSAITHITVINNNIKDNEGAQGP